MRAWLRQLLGHSSSAKTLRKKVRGPEASRATVRRRCVLESLEDRLAPAVITVTTLADSQVVDGLVSLREAIQAAETNTSVDGSAVGTATDTIQFHSNLAGSIN